MTWRRPGAEVVRIFGNVWRIEKKRDTRNLHLAIHDAAKATVLTYIGSSDPNLGISSQ